MTKKLISASLITLMALAAVATPSEARSRSYCQAYARDVANHRAGAPQVLGGAAAGAIGGAVLGAIIGGHHAVRNGAIIGGIGGTVVGGVNANGKWRRTYDRAYAQCRSW
jgi:uncharacterized membrane protein